METKRPLHIPTIFDLIMWERGWEGHTPYCKICGKVLSYYDSSAPIGEELRLHGCGHINSLREQLKKRDTKLWKVGIDFPTWLKEQEPLNFLTDSERAVLLADELYKDYRKACAERDIFPVILWVDCLGYVTGKERSKS